MTTIVPNALRPGLPPLPPRIADLPVDARGFPVPWHVAWIEGEPDGRIVDERKIPLAVAHGLCWICGQRMGTAKTFSLGQLAAAWMECEEPPAHLECARYATNLPPSRPVVALCTTSRYAIRHGINGGVLFRLARSESLEWLTTAEAPS